MVLILCKIAQLHIVTHFCIHVIHVGHLNNSFVIKMKACYYMKLLVNQLVRISSENYYIQQIPFDYVISVVVFLMNASNYFKFWPVVALLRISTMV